MENRYSRPDGKAAGFPTARKHRFPQLRRHGRLHTFPQRLLLRTSFLSDPNGKRKKRTKKEAGASPSAQTEGGAPALLWKSVQKRLSAPPKSEGKARMGNHKGGSRKSHRRRFFSPFSTPICTLFRACGLVMGTGDEDRPKALLGLADHRLDLLTLGAGQLAPCPCRFCGSCRFCLQSLSPPVPIRTAAPGRSTGCWSGRSASLGG